MTYPINEEDAYQEWEYPEHFHEFVNTSQEFAHSGGKDYQVQYCLQCPERRFVEI